MGVLGAAWDVLLDVACFWHRRLWQWYRRKSPIDLWLDALHHSEAYEDWEEAALHLDNLLGLDQWRNNPTSKHYDWRLINERLDLLSSAKEDHNLSQLANLLRSGLVRNLANITSPRLYNRSFAGTKYLIEEYVAQIADAIETIGDLPTMEEVQAMVTAGPQQPNRGAGGGGGSPDSNHDGGLAGPRFTVSTQIKLDFIHDTRQAFGRSTLVLQGGAIFGLCHLGVVKALFLRGLLPRIITGTATGALIAALVAIHTEDELPAVLRGDGIDLSAFEGKVGLGGLPARESDQAPGNGQEGTVPRGPRQTFRTWWETLLRRVRRFRKEGYFLDVKVLEECVRANVGDLTFEEAYNRSKRVLNITVATAGHGGVPTLLNYLTAPNVLIWTAAVASNASSASFYGTKGTTVLCKDAHGNVVPWAPANTVDFRHWTHVSYNERESPLSRIAELFNVNHFIVSQARPYLIPFLQSDMHGPSHLQAIWRPVQMTAFTFRLIGMELRHRLRQADALGILPAGIRRFLVDERIPGPSMVLVPHVTPSDFIRLLETPTRETLDYWILRGQRSVWPAVAALQVRCGIENELDHAYQKVRRLKAGGLRRRGSTAMVPATEISALVAGAYPTAAATGTAMGTLGSAVEVANASPRRDRIRRARASSTSARHSVY